MHALLLLLALQAGRDSTYSSPAVRDLVTRAVARNRARSTEVRGFRAHFESSVAVVRTAPERVEGATSIEQTAGTYRARTGGFFEQHREGYRVITTGVPLPGGTLLRKGWIAPPLDGEWPNLLMASRSIDQMLVLPDSSSAPADSTAHPLAPDGERLYRYGGGDTVWTETPDGERLQLVRLEVWPAERAPARTRVFRGELYFDPLTADLRRARGQLLTIGGPPPGFRARVTNLAVPSARLVDLVFTEVPGAGMVPTWQWIELRIQLPLEVEGFTALRVTTRLTDPVLFAGDAVSADSPVHAGISTAPNDSLRRFRGWLAPPTRDPARVRQRMLADVGPLRARPTGPPVFAFRNTSTGDFLRYNRVEGLFTGIHGRIRFRDAAPGLSLRAGVGYAWKSRVTRPEALIRWEGATWFAQAGAERALELATKFPGPLEQGFGLRALLGEDNFDYVDRRLAGASIGRYLSENHAGLIAADVAWVEDRATPAVLAHGALGQNLEPNPGIDPGRYRRTRLRFELNPEISPGFATPGLALRLGYERGDGHLRYDRYQAEVIARANWRWLLFTLVGDVGMVRGDSVPPQQLFLLGGQGTLPGYSYDRFAGDRAALVRGLLNIPLPFGATPIRLSRSISLPPLAPTISLRVYSGWTDASSASARASISRLGTRPGSGGTTIPFAAASGRIRATTEARLLLLGGLVGFGVARPLEAGRRWKFQFSFGQTF